MPAYADGSPVQLHDRVSLYHEKELGEVEAIVESQADQASWGVGEPGIVFRTKSYGLIMESMEALQDPQEIRFVSRRTE